MNGLHGNDSVERLSRFNLIVGALILFFMVMAYSPAAFGQGATGAINGTVADTSGAVIPNAKIILQNTATGAARTALTNATGTYVFPEVIPGSYTMQVSAEGFTAAKAEAFTLNVNQTVTQNFSLSVGATKQEVTVQATVVHIESSTAELGTAIAPIEQIAMNASINSGESCSKIATRSLFATFRKANVLAMVKVSWRSSA